MILHICRCRERERKKSSESDNPSLPFCFVLPLPLPEVMVFGNSTGGGGFRAGKQVFPVDYEAEVSQRLIDASLVNNLKLAFECIDDPFVDVNYVGAVSFKVRKAEVVLREDSPNEVRVEYQEFRTDVTALFIAVHNGNVALVRKLLVMFYYTIY